jgi:hypothetical protein
MDSHGSSPWRKGRGGGKEVRVGCGGGASRRGCHREEGGAPWGVAA